jgi:hypothetical protein
LQNIFRNSFLWNHPHDENPKAWMPAGDQLPPGIFVAELATNDSESVGGF